MLSAARAQTPFPPGCSSIAPMRKTMLGGCLLFFLVAPISSGTQNRRSPSALPEQFEIGRRTFFDFGPPFDFYEILIVRPDASGASVERILLTPPGDKCFAPAKVESAQAKISETVATLLGSNNPCTIPEKELSRERKRSKKGLVFSGADVAMQVRCEDHTRLIRSEILDRNMFDRATQTPDNTSWTTRLLEVIDKTIGPGVMDKPMFATPRSGAPRVAETQAMRDLAAGNYDNLFPDAPDKPSGLYHASQLRPPVPEIRLVDSSPIAPDVFVSPVYPPIARMAHVEGTVSFTIQIDAEGAATNFVPTSGSPLLHASIKEATSGWKFPKAAAGQSVRVWLEFKLNCDR